METARMTEEVNCVLCIAIQNLCLPLHVDSLYLLKFKLDFSAKCGATSLYNINSFGKFLNEKF